VALAILLTAAAGIGVLGWSVVANGGPFAGDEGPARECTTKNCAGLDFPTDGDNLFNFPSPPAGSTCQQVIDYVRQNVPREGRMAGGVRFYSTFSSELGSGVPPDFVVDVISPLSRDDFLQRKKWSEEKFQNWLLMSTGLTFGTISALFGLNHGYIDQEKYTVLVVGVILSAV